MKKKTKEHNPYSLYTKLGMDEPDFDTLKNIQKREDTLFNIRKAFDIWTPRRFLIKTLIKETIHTENYRPVIKTLKSIFPHKEKDKEIRYFYNKFKTR